MLLVFFMVFRLFLSCVVLLNSVACQHYIVRSSSTGSIDRFKVAKYKVASVVEAESDPNRSQKEENVVFIDVNKKRKDAFEKAFSKEIEKVFGKNDNGNEEFNVNVKINRNIGCIFNVDLKCGSHFCISPGYKQIGSIMLNLSGLSPTNQEVFNIDIEYDMNDGTTSIAKSLACDSFDKVTKVINEKILPLAIREIGQNRVNEVLR